MIRNRHRAAASAGLFNKPAPRSMASARLLATACAMLAGGQASAQTVGQNGQRLLLSIPPLIAAITANGQETISYTYDAKSRLVRVFRDGAINDVTTTYLYDAADNRRQLTTTGSTNTPQP